MTLGRVWVNVENQYGRLGMLYPLSPFLKHCRLEHTNRSFERDTQNANLSNVRDLNDKRLPSMPLVKGDMVSKQTGIIYNSFRHFKTSASRD